MSQTVEVRTAAWHGDRALLLSFPDSWDVSVVGRSPGPPLASSELRARLRTPVGTPRLSELAQSAHRAAIIIDDISRPTPTAELLPLILEELAIGGLPASRTRIIIAAGGHAEASEEENLKKVGRDVAERIGYELHDPDGDLVAAGKSPSGIPLYVNRNVMEADLKIGVGGIIPHEAAGFSGGSKILVPGVAGTETARYLHDLLRNAKRRGGSIDNEFRRELDVITGELGLSFIVNVILDHQRRIVGLFAGDRVLAHREGARTAAREFSVEPVSDPDIVVSNAYPFDSNLWFVPWGLWPLSLAPDGATRVVLADGSEGAGSHRLKPTELSFGRRAWKRLLTLRPRHVWKQVRHLYTSLRRTRRRRIMEFLLLCPNISQEELSSRFYGATLFRRWDDLLDELKRRHGEGRVKVAVYPCAPLQVPVVSEMSET